MTEICVMEDDLATNSYHLVSEEESNVGLHLKLQGTASENLMHFEKLIYKI